ncbi:MAG: class I SAM-dependent methyltransferase [Thermoplasmata archaeon]
MGEQYFEKRPASAHRPREIRFAIRGHAFTFRTDAGVFSRGKLDRGTELLLEAIAIRPRQRVLDLGCGYGAIGIVAARLSGIGPVVLTDVNERAVALARTNLVVNGIRNGEVRLGPLYEPVGGMAFDHIVSNPPIRAGRGIVDRIVADAPAHLVDGGSLWLVARTRQGADALRSRMAMAFGSAEIVERGSGFKVLRSTRPEA